MMQHDSVIQSSINLLMCQAKQVGHKLGSSMGGQMKPTYSKDIANVRHCNCKGLAEGGERYTKSMAKVGQRLNKGRAKFGQARLSLVGQ